MTISSLTIGNVKVDPPILLAPMAGYTTPPFRHICGKMGSGLNFTEMVPAEGIRRRLPQTMIYLDALPEEGPLAAHIYGTDPEAFARAAQIIESLGRFDIIDINCGCPVRKIAGKGAGVALMQEPDKIRAIVKATTEATVLPVTIKTRTGISERSKNVSQVVQAAEDGGASAITIHARLATQRHSGPVDFEMLRQVKSESSIPVIGNGGIKSAEQAIAMFEQTGVDGIMIGQGAIGNPWVFREIRCALSGTQYNQPNIAETKETIVEHLYGLYELMQRKNQVRKRPSPHVERLTCEAFRSYLGQYLKGKRGIKRLQGNLMQLPTIAEVLTAIEAILEGQFSNDS